MVGSLGSAERLKFTTIGDAVNIVARLENFQKDVGAPNMVCWILIRETPKQYFGVHPYVVKYEGSVMLKGETQGISVYRLYSKEGEQSVQ